MVTETDRYDEIHDYLFRSEVAPQGIDFERAAWMASEIRRLRDLAQGRLEHFQHSEESRRLHFMRAERAREALREIMEMDISGDDLYHSSASAMQAMAQDALDAESRR